MDRGIWIGLGISIVSGLMPYAIKTVPPYLAWPGITAGLAIAIYAAISEASRPPLVSGCLYLLASVAVAAGLAYQLTRPAKVAVEADPLNGTVDFRCEQTQIPTVVPQEGGYNVIPTFFNGENVQMAIARMGFQQAPGTAITYPDGLAPWAVLCRLTNYGEKPLYGLKIPVELSVHERIQDPNNPQNPTARTAGPAIWSGKSSVYIDKLDTGADRTYSFFIQGLNKFVGILFSDEFTARPFTGEQKRRINFVKTNTSRDRSVMVAPANPEPAPASAGASDTKQ